MTQCKCKPPRIQKRVAFRALGSAWKRADTFCAIQGSCTKYVSPLSGTACQDMECLLPRLGLLMLLTFALSSQNCVSRQITKMFSSPTTCPSTAQFLELDPPIPRHNSITGTSIYNLMVLYSFEKERKKRRQRNRGTGRQIRFSFGGEKKAYVRQKKKKKRVWVSLLFRTVIRKNKGQSIWERNTDKEGRVVVAIAMPCQDPSHTTSYCHISFRLRSRIGDVGGHRWELQHWCPSRWAWLPGSMRPSRRRYCASWQPSTEWDRTAWQATQEEQWRGPSSWSAVPASEKRNSKQLRGQVWRGCCLMRLFVGFYRLLRGSNRANN